MTIYSAGFKEAILKKVFADNGKSVTQIAREIGIPKSTVFTWVDRMKRKNTNTSSDTNNLFLSKKDDGICDFDKPVKPYSKAEKLEFVIQYFSLDTDSRGEFLRTHGLYSMELESWKNEFIGSMTGVAAAKQKSLKKDIKKIKLLERDLRRKDKALAEASALLILKKKADLLWGKSED